MGDMDLDSEGGVSAVMGDTDRQLVIDDLTGGPDRTAEDVIAGLDQMACDLEWAVESGAPWRDTVKAAARLLREAQADVDAATRLRTAIEAHKATQQWSAYATQAHDIELWEAAAAVGSVDPDRGTS